MGHCQCKGDTSCLSFLVPDLRRKPHADDAPIEMIMFADLDGTWLGDPHSTRELNSFWVTYSRSHSTMLVYNIGRPAQQVKYWISQGRLPPVEYTINNDRLWEAWQRHLRSQGCTLKLFDYLEDIIEDFGMDECNIESRLCGFELSMKITSTQGTRCLVNGYCKINAAIRRLNLPGMYVYDYNLKQIADMVQEDWWSADEYGLETRVVPQIAHASKGPAAHFLYEYVCQQQQQVPYAIWAGDGENDCGMLEDTKFHGIVVSNAAAQLKEACAQYKDSRYVYFSSQRMSEGVLEGLRFMLARRLEETASRRQNG